MQTIKYAETVESLADDILEAMPGSSKKQNNNKIEHTVACVSDTTMFIHFECIHALTTDAGYGTKYPSIMLYLKKQ